MPKLPVGGYKGYGLAVMLSALAGILSGALDDPAVSAGEGAPEKPFAQGHFIMALDIAKFIPVAEFRRRAGAYIDAIKSTPKSAGANDIYLPGEQSWQRWQDRMQNGIPLSESLSADLRKLGDSLDIKFRPQWAGSEDGPARRKGIGTMEANVQ